MRIAHQARQTPPCLTESARPSDECCYANHYYYYYYYYYCHHYYHYYLYYHYYHYYYYYHYYHRLKWVLSGIWPRAPHCTACREPVL